MSIDKNLFSRIVLGHMTHEWLSTKEITTRVNRAFIFAHLAKFTPHQIATKLCWMRGEGLVLGSGKMGWRKPND